MHPWLAAAPDGSVWVSWDVVRLKNHGYSGGSTITGANKQRDLADTRRRRSQPLERHRRPRARRRHRPHPRRPARADRRAAGLRARPPRARQDRDQPQRRAVGRLPRADEADRAVVAERARRLPVGSAWPARSATARGRTPSSSTAATATSKSRRWRRSKSGHQGRVHVSEHRHSTARRRRVRDEEARRAAGRSSRPTTQRDRKPPTTTTTTSTACSAGTATSTSRRCRTSLSPDDQAREPAARKSADRPRRRPAPRARRRHARGRRRTAAKYKLLWGDLHRHSNVSRCTVGNEPNPEDLYRYGIDIDMYDFLGSQRPRRVHDRLLLVAAAEGRRPVPHPRRA